MGDGSPWNFAAGAIAVLFIIYITAKGELAGYLQLLLYTPPATPPVPAQSSAQAANPVFNAIPGIGGTLFPNSTTQGAQSSPWSTLNPFNLFSTPAH